jgi:hypothetical protein
MDYTKFAQLPVIDGHVHYGNPAYMEGLMDIIDRFQIDRVNIVCTPDRQRLSLIPDALHLKDHYPERVYVFGGMDISAFFIMPNNVGEFFAGYVDTLRNMGCDGVKMIEGKPDMRKTLPIPDFDSEVYAPYWQKLAETGTPVVFHVNDPEEFWDQERVPDWAVERGWFYGDGTYINNEAQYTQVLNVLDRHPDLKVIFAHFFFLSAQLDRLGEYFDRYPNMCVDLTPGIEMYFNFAANPEKARDFFIKYQERIVYGTDIGAKALLTTPEIGIEEEESWSRVDVVRSFLETEGSFKLKNKGGFLFGDSAEPFQGIHLPQSALENIYYKNFERLAGNKPAPLNPAAIVAECERLTAMIGAMGAVQPDQPADPSVAQMVKSYFEAQL